MDQLDRSTLDELIPVVRRATDLNPHALVRIRAAGDSAALFARLPFGVLVGRTLARAESDADIDVTVSGADLVAWLDADGPVPAPRDAEWRGAVPPVIGWRRIETVPDSVLRDLVRTGALALKEAAAREGVPGAQPRAEVADALLDSTVLTVSADDGGAQVAVSLRALSALTRMGFLARGSHAHVDTCGRWTRIAAAYGSVYLERTELGLGLVIH